MTKMITWGSIAAVLTAVILVIDFFTKSLGAGEAIVEWFRPAPSPQVTVTVRTVNVPGNSQCLEFAFADLPETFKLGKIRLNVQRATGPETISGDQSAAITVREVNAILPIELFLSPKPIEFRAAVEATKKHDAFFVDFCAKLDVPGQSGTLVVAPEFFLPTGEKIEGLKQKIAGGRSTISFRVSSPNSVPAKLDAGKLQILKR